MKKILIIILLNILSFNYIISSEKAISKSIDFNSWQEKCAQLPKYRSLFKQNKINLSSILNNTQEYLKYRACDLEEFNNTLNNFFEVIKKSSLSNQKNWLKSAPLKHDTFFDINSNKFKPYVQKLIVKNNATIAIIGDMHGDIHSLIGFIKSLENKNYLDGFKIKDKNFYILFLGDYVDRGIYGTEVIYTLLNLKIENPENVILIRGNHEDTQLTRTYGFQEEFINKFSDYDNQSINRVLDKISKFYNFLPLALYLGTGTKNLKNFLQCCHGGLEIGFNPKEILHNNQDLKFQWLESINQLDEAKNLGDFKIDYGANEINLSQLCHNFTPISPTLPHPIGFMWNDFEPNANKNSSYSDFRGFQFNKEITQKVMEVASTENNKLSGIIRAHQHNPSNSDELMKLMISSDGIANLWQESGLVYTFLLQPDSLYGMKLPNFSGFLFSSYGLLEMSTKFENWKLNTINFSIY